MRAGRLVPLLIVVGLLGGPPGRVEDRPDPIGDAGLVEKSGVELMLVDVEVTKKDGSPLPGLHKDDFRVELDHRDWPIYSVDDLCECGLHEAAGAVVQTGTAAVAPDHEAEPLKFVLYLDYSQLQQDGREHAVEAARRWIQETKQAQDEVMLVAHAEDAGLKVLADFTTDRASLLAALERSCRDPKLVDPFPAALPLRWDACRRICQTAPKLSGVCEHCWKDAADQEVLHGQHAFEALEYLLVRLQSVPGRKALVLFNQNGTLFPARYYPVDQDEVGDQVALVDRVAAEATLARTRIYTAYAGDGDNALATSLGANLAQFTGGGHNRVLATLAELMSDAGRGCTCTYRIGLTPPEDDRIFNLTVAVRGRRLPHTQRVQHVSDGERSMRMARAILLDPQSADDLPLVAAIVPVARSEHGWELELQVGVSADALLLLPSAEKKKASWEVGALLAEQSARRSWEMVGVAELLRETDRPSAMTILHTRRMQDLRPGSYQLRAFVHDRITDVYGGALATIELPAETDSIVGPFMRSAGGQFFRTTLPLRGKEGSTAPLAVRAVETGSLPIGDRSVRTGETLEFTSWACGPNARETLLQARRFVTNEHDALFRFDAPTLAVDRDCARLSDRLDTSELAAGSYSYRMRLDRGPDDAAEDVVARFEIDSGRPTESLPATAADLE